MSEGEIEFESQRRRDDIAADLETLAEALRGGGEFELQVGAEAVTVDPPESVEYEIEIEDEHDDGAVERSIEIELEWDRQEHEEPIEGGE